MLSGILTPTSGRILIDRPGCRGELSRHQAKIGYVPESGGLYESLTGFEFLELNWPLVSPGGNGDPAQTEEFFRLFGLQEAMHRALVGLLERNASKRSNQFGPHPQSGPHLFR